LASLFYAPITEAADTGYETYGDPVLLSKVISAEMSIEITNATLYADDAASDVVREFQTGTLTLNVRDLPANVAAELVGASIDDQGLLAFSGEDSGNPVAIGFKAKKPNGEYRHFWVYRVKFAVPSTSLKTKADTIEFATPSIEGTIMVRNKPDSRGKHPWKIEATEGDPAVAAATLTTWFDAVPEPAFDTTPPSEPPSEIG
jgi:phi13 family phage major tail protein